MWSSIAVPLPAIDECSSFSQAPQHLLCRVVKFGGSNSTSGSEAVSLCGFNLHFPTADDGEYLFMGFPAICIPSLENQCLVPLPILCLGCLLLNCMSCELFIHFGN